MRLVNLMVPIPMLVALLDNTTVDGMDANLALLAIVALEMIRCILALPAMLSLKWAKLPATSVDLTPLLMREHLSAPLASSMFPPTLTPSNALIRVILASCAVADIKRFFSS